MRKLNNKTSLQFIIYLILIIKLYQIKLILLRHSPQDKYSRTSTHYVQTQVTGHFLFDQAEKEDMELNVYPWSVL
jgi:hypothetical protein